MRRGSTGRLVLAAAVLSAAVMVLSWRWPLARYVLGAAMLYVWGAITLAALTLGRVRAPHRGAGELFRAGYRRLPWLDSATADVWAEPPAGNVRKRWTTDQPVPGR